MPITFRYDGRRSTQIELRSRLAKVGVDRRSDLMQDPLARAEARITKCLIDAVGDLRGLLGAAFLDQEITLEIKDDLMSEPPDTIASFELDRPDLPGPLFHCSGHTVLSFLCGELGLPLATGRDYTPGTWHHELVHYADRLELERHSAWRDGLPRWQPQQDRELGLVLHALDAWRPCILRIQLILHHLRAEGIARLAEYLFGCREDGLCKREEAWVTFRQVLIAFVGLLSAGGVPSATSTKSGVRLNADMVEAHLKSLSYVCGPWFILDALSEAWGAGDAGGLRSRVEACILGTGPKLGVEEANGVLRQATELSLAGCLYWSSSPNVAGCWAPFLSRTEIVDLFTQFPLVGEPAVEVGFVRRLGEAAARKDVPAFCSLLEEPLGTPMSDDEIRTALRNFQPARVVGRKLGVRLMTLARQTLDDSRCAPEIRRWALTYLLDAEDAVPDGTFAAGLLDDLTVLELAGDLSQPAEPLPPP